MKKVLIASVLAFSLVSVSAFAQLAAIAKGASTIKSSQDGSHKTQSPPVVESAVRGAATTVETKAATAQSQVKNDIQSVAEEKQPVSLQEVTKTTG